MSQIPVPESDQKPDLSEYFARRRRLLEQSMASRRLSLSEIRGAGWALANDPNDLRIFGMSPLVWFPLGFRILGRTAVELTRDLHAGFLARSVAETLAGQGLHIADVIDPFLGSGNLFFHVLRAVGASRGIGLDVNADVLALTARNLSRLRLFGRLKAKELFFHRQDCAHAPGYLQDRSTLLIIDPPWGEAFDARGLDLGKTMPPVSDILDTMRRAMKTAPAFALVKTHPMMVAQSVDALTGAYPAFPAIASTDPAIATRVDYMLLRLLRD
jgi:predicted RNA methylase